MKKSKKISKLSSSAKKNNCKMKKRLRFSEKHSKIRKYANI